MKYHRNYLILLTSLLVTACGGGSGGSSGTAASPTDETGTITVAITDGPMEEAQELTLRLTHVDFGHANGDVTRLQIHDGPTDVDMISLQNGITHDLVDHASLPAGEYQWMELGVDLEHSHIGLDGGGHYGLQLGDPEAFRINQQFTIRTQEHSEFVMDFDLRNAVQHHHMGGMMGDSFELHHALRLMNVEDAGGLMGSVDDTLIDINHPDCDPALGGNWAYLFPGDATQPDDLAETETDGFSGPIAADRVELHDGSGEYRYYFAFVPEGSYRVAFSCSSDWDEPGDDDYPQDPDGMFGFQAFSGPVEVVAGQMTEFHVAP